MIDGKLSDTMQVVPIDAVECVSKDGYQFNLNAMDWHIGKDSKIHLDWVYELDESLREGAIKTLAYFAREQSGAHTVNMFYRMRHFVHLLHLKTITSADLINYRGMLDKTHQWYLGTIRVFLKKWFDLGYPGIASETIELLISWRLGGNEKGQAVLSVDPENGPFSDFELSAIHDKLVEAYAEGKISSEAFAMTLTIANTGRRPRQIGDLKAGDVYQAKNKDGISTYFINFPRRKLRGINWRSQFRAYAITEDLWLALRKHIEKITRKLSHQLGRELEKE